MVRPTFIHHSSACGRIAPQNVAFQFQIVPGSRSIHLTDSTNLALHATNFSRTPVFNTYSETGRWVVGFFRWIYPGLTRCAVCASLAADHRDAVALVSSEQSWIVAAAVLSVPVSIKT